MLFFLNFALSDCDSKKKRCVIYGKWTECMWSVDPQTFEGHKKSDKKGGADTKKQKQVRSVCVCVRVCVCLCLCVVCVRVHVHACPGWTLSPPFFVGDGRQLESSVFSVLF